MPAERGRRHTGAVHSRSLSCAQPTAHNQVYTTDARRAYAMLRADTALGGCWKPALGQGEAAPCPGAEGRDALRAGLGDSVGGVSSAVVLFVFQCVCARRCLHFTMYKVSNRIVYIVIDRFSFSRIYHTSSHDDDRQSDRLYRRKQSCDTGVAAPDSLKTKINVATLNSLLMAYVAERPTRHHLGYSICTIGGLQCLAGSGRCTSG